MRDYLAYVERTYGSVDEYNRIQEEEMAMMYDMNKCDIYNCPVSRPLFCSEDCGAGKGCQFAKYIRVNKPVSSRGQNDTNSSATPAEDLEFISVTAVRGDYKMIYKNRKHNLYGYELNGSWVVKSYDKKPVPDRVWAMFIRGIERHLALSARSF